MAITYTVRYKKLGWWFWRKLRNVEADGYVFIQQAGTFNIRYFLLADKTRVEIPTQDVLFQFDKDRFNASKENLNRETGRA